MAFKVCMLLVNVLDWLKNRILPPPAALMVMVSENHMLSHCIKIAADLQIPDKLKEGGSKHIDLLAQETNTDPDSLFRIMRALAGKGIFKETSRRTFANTRLTEAFRSDRSNSLLEFIKLAGSDWHYTLIGNLMMSVRNGKDANENLHGIRFFDWLNLNPLAQKTFSEGMTGLSNLSNNAVANSYNFKDANTIVDVGGGVGGQLSTILTQNSHLTGTLFEMPGVIEQARQKSYLSNENLEGRIGFEEGSFFKLVPSGGDIYFMKSVIHDWEDEAAIKILIKCRRAMHSKSKLLLVEMLVNDNGKHCPGKLIDIAMLAITGGRERTKNEYENLLQKAGLKLNRVLSTSSPYSIIEAVKCK